MLFQAPPNRFFFCRYWVKILHEHFSITLSLFFVREKYLFWAKMLQHAWGLIRTTPIWSTSAWPLTLCHNFPTAYGHKFYTLRFWLRICRLYFWWFLTLAQNAAYAFFICLMSLHHFISGFLILSLSEIMPSQNGQGRYFDILLSNLFISCWFTRRLMA